MSDAELEAIEAAAAAATPGPWEAMGASVASELADEHDYPVLSINCEITELTEEDAAFIAAARAWVPQLVALVRKMAGHLGAAKDLINEAREIILRQQAELTTLRQQQARELHDEQEG